MLFFGFGFPLPKLMWFWQPVKSALKCGYAMGPWPSLRVRIPCRAGFVLVRKNEPSWACALLDSCPSHTWSLLQPTAQHFFSCHVQISTISLWDARKMRLSSLRASIFQNYVLNKSFWWVINQAQMFATIS